jgi:hypothetical protein
MMRQCRDKLKQQSDYTLVGNMATPLYHSLATKATLYVPRFQINLIKA